MNRDLRRLAILAVSLGLVLAPVRADAQPSPSAADRETARYLLNSGRDKFAAKDYDGAIYDFKAAHDIMGVPTTGLDLAKALDAKGQLIEARNTALDVVRLPPSPSEPQAFTDARTEAEALADRLRLRIPSLVITVKGLPAEVVPTVTVEGVMVPVSTLNVPRKVNPGSYTVTASASGYKTVQLMGVTKEGEAVPVFLTMVREPAADAPTLHEVIPGPISATPSKSEAAPNLPSIAPPPTKPKDSKKAVHVLNVLPQPTQEERTWYGWQNMLSLGASTALAVPAVMGITSEDHSSGWFVMAGFAGAGLGLGGPIVHWAHGNVGKGFKALALNVSFTGGGGAVGYGIAQALENNGSADTMGTGIGAGIGFFFAALIDVAVTSYDEAEAPPVKGGREPRVAIAPLVDLRSDHKVLGVSGAF